MTGRDRVLAALNFQPPDRLPRDLGGMPSTNISCFAYPGLVAALGLPYRRPRVYDTGQMLALPETDVLDALGCDVVTLQPNLTNAFPQPELWHPYDFGGRLDAEVLNPTAFETLADGTILQNRGQLSMPPAAYVFDSEHAGQPLVLEGDLPRPDLNNLEKELSENTPTREQVAQLLEMSRHARHATDRAILFNGMQAGIGIGNFTGVAMFPMLCLTDPGFVAELHALMISHAVRQLERWLPALGPNIDVYMCSADDWGTQNATIASPEMYCTLFQPFYRQMNDTIHRLAPNVKTFFHSCGAVYTLIDDIIDSGFDVLNPVQWTAGGRHWREWKDKGRGRIALWGGGVDTQTTLPLGSIEAIERQVREVVGYFQQDSGYIFCAIHNILAEIAPEKVIALYRAAGSC
ncbi:MAG TPA: uroporphyrinogen decarboxylase family protein [Candidatus Hydrogenedentes bacterium]|nr:uroporphyrinogen decarboxylase family protein [Candidatus Hydrogenedentota bacterium]